DGDEMGRSAVTRLVAVRPNHRDTRGRTRRDGRHPPIRVYQPAASDEVTRVHQSRDGNRDVVAVGQIPFAVGEGEPLRFGEQMPELRRLRPQSSEVEPLELLEDRVDSRCARRRRPHSADAVTAIVAADGWALLHRVAREIAEGHSGAWALCRYPAGDRLRMLAAVEPFRAMAGDVLERL